MMVKPIKITVITVVKNGMPFVEQTMDSVLSQTYPNLEYIVIDGGSTDGTVEAIRSRESCITRWVSEQDEGIADAFNKGLSFSTGDYLMFLNADDELVSRSTLAEMAEMIILHGFPALIYGDCDVLDRVSGQVRYRTNIEFSPRGLRRGKTLPHPSMLASRGYFEKYGDFDERFTIAMDYEWLLRGAFGEKVVHIPMQATRVRDGGVSARNRRRAVGEIILALENNGIISNPWGKWKMQGYFFARSLARVILNRVGLYQKYREIQNGKR